MLSAEGHTLDDADRTWCICTAREAPLLITDAGGMGGTMVSDLSLMFMVVIVLLVLVLSIVGSIYLVKYLMRYTYES